MTVSVSSTPAAAVLVADDHHLIREIVKTYLLKLVPQALLLEAGTYPEVLKRAQEATQRGERLNLAVIDLDMPGLPEEDTFRNLQDVCSALAETPVVVFSAEDDAFTIAKAMSCGVRGYIGKSMAGAALMSAFRVVLDGGTYFPPQLVLDARVRNGRPDAPSLGDLTPPELLCLKHATAGHGDKEIATLMPLRVTTVQMHLRNAYKKLGVTRRTQAIGLAVALHIDEFAALHARN